MSSIESTNDKLIRPQTLVSMPNMMLENKSEPTLIISQKTNSRSTDPTRILSTAVCFSQERGAAKQREWQQAVQQQRQEEEAARIPYAHPLPFSLDVPQVGLEKEPVHVFTN